MEEVYSCMIDTRGDRPRLLSGASSSWLGPQVRRTDDLGAHLAGVARTARSGSPRTSSASVERVWQLVPGSEPGVVYAGTEPGAVWRSEDGGESFALERALWDHPQRPDWGAGFGGQAFHTILPHPTDPQSVTVAISTGGVYQTTDGGASWTAAQPGHPRGVPAGGPAVPRVRPVRAQGDPAPRRVRSGCTCRTTAASTAPTTTARAGTTSATGSRPTSASRSWSTRTSPDTVFVFPINGGERRYPPEAKARVWRSRDAGGSWEELGDGLPDDFFVGVMRDAMCADTHDPAGLYFGARNGAVWGSADAGETWQQVVADLPDVMVVKAAKV